MSAREFLVQRCGGNPRMVDAFRAEVLNEAADKLALALTADGHSLPGYPLAVRSAVRELRRMTDEAVAS